jgi:hypothetical protein
LSYKPCITEKSARIAWQVFGVFMVVTYETRPLSSDGGTCLNDQQFVDNSAKGVEYAA